MNKHVQVSADAKDFDVEDIVRRASIGDTEAFGILISGNVYSHLHRSKEKLRRYLKISSDNSLNQHSHSVSMLSGKLKSPYSMLERIIGLMNSRGNTVDTTSLIGESGLAFRLKISNKRTKANQNKFFIGYRKHSVPARKVRSSWFSIILPNDTADIKVMLPLIEMIKKIEGLKVDYLVADLGYFDANDQKEALLKHDVAVVPEIKKNTIIPEQCSPEGKPECEQGHALVFDGFDKNTYTAWFRGDDERCAACPL